MMCHCWQYRADDRPTFRELTCWLESTLHSDTDYLDLNPRMVNNATYLRPISAASANFNSSSSLSSDPSSSLPLLRDIANSQDTVQLPLERAPRPPVTQKDDGHRRRHHLEADRIRSRRKEAAARARSRTITLPMVESNSGDLKVEFGREEEEEVRLLRSSNSCNDNENNSGQCYAVTYSRLSSAPAAIPAPNSGDIVSTSSKLTNHATPV